MKRINARTRKAVDKALRRGDTYRAIAKRFKVSRGTVYRIEHGLLPV